MSVRLPDGSAPIESVQYADSGQRDATGRLRVSMPKSFFESTFEYNVDSFQWEDVVTGGATVAHLSNLNAVRLRCGTASGDKAVRQTRSYFLVGRIAAMVNVAAVLDAAVAGVRRRLGYFDASDGVFLEQTGSGLAIVRRSSTSGSVVDDRIPQANWALDRLDGGGLSRIRLDQTKLQNLVIDFKRRGRLRVGFELGLGDVVWAHQFISPNVLTSDWTRTPALPVRLEIENTTVQASAHDLIASAASVVSEQDFLESGISFPFTAGNGITPINVTDRRPVLSIRPAATFGGRTNRSRILTTEISTLVSGGSALIEVVYAPTLTGASFGAVSPASAVEYDTSALSLSGGYVVHSLHVAAGPGLSTTTAGMDFFSRLPLVLDAAGTNPSVASVVATSFTGGVQVAAQVNWSEIR